MTNIARAYDSEQQALDAKSQLIAAGLTEDRISVVTPNLSSPGDSLRAGNSLGQHRGAESYARALDKGQTVLVANVYFGTGVAMSAIMDSCNPAMVDPVDDEDDPYHRGTPMSFALGMPVLMRDNPAPLSRFLGMSTESKGRSFLSKWFGGELLHSASPLSSALNMSTVTSGGGTTSSRFGMPELYEEQLGDSALGVPLLSKNSAPFSSMLGMKCLSGNPAPLSTMFGMSVLTGLNDKTPSPPPPPREYP
jgi:hypothetical protein